MKYSHEAILLAGLNGSHKYPRQLTVLFIGVALLLCFWLTRTWHILAFPTFIDEVFHINFGAHVLQTGPFIHADEGRQLTIWWYILFQSQAAAPVWTARIATILIAVLGMAAIIRVGYLSSGLPGMIVSGFVYLFSTYHLFFERLALADPVSAAFVYISLYLAYRLSRRIAIQDAILTGITLFLAVGAKISALPYLALPIIAALSLRPSRRTWRVQFTWAAIALGVALSLTAIYHAIIIWRGYDPLFYLSPGSALEGQGIAVGLLLARIPENILVLVSLISHYFGAVGVVIVALSVVYLVWQKQLYLPLAVFLPTLILWVSPRQSTRHLIVPMTLLLLCAALLVVRLIQHRSQLTQRIALGGVLIWGLVTWLPFMNTLTSNPAQLPLSSADVHEYITSEASGFGLAEVRAILNQQPVQEIIGILSNCFGLKWISEDDFLVNCPNINPTGESIEALQALMENNRSEGVYVVLEASAYLPDEAPGKLIAVIERPRGGVPLSIYHLAPDT